jgi:[histone H3]-lysine9 N-trimethyltransferase SUV39H
MTAMEDNIDDDVDVYEIQSSVLSDLTPADSPYITWRSVRRAARERTPKFLKARDLPHTLQDYMNALPAMYRKTDEARLIFEAAIRESTADDEPDAPPIEIYNKIDDEVTPPWEFHYSNKMWYGEGVPGPDSKSLRGCDCEGRCDPQSKTCLCVKKQSEYLEQSGFVYNDKGRLIDPLHYPIFECNDFCGCGEECQNRVRAQILTDNANSDVTP